MDYKKYKAPKNDEGKPYWVPIVVKNRDQLIGYLECMIQLSMAYKLPLNDTIKLLSSDRFNDITRTGKRYGKMSKDEKYNHFKDIIIEQHDECDHFEQTDDILNEFEFGVNCECGNFVGFRHILEVPDTNLKCELCDRILIDYTGCDDIEFDYDGKPGSEDEIRELIQTIHEELGIANEDFDDEEDDNDDYLGG